MQCGTQGGWDTVVSVQQRPLGCTERRCGLLPSQSEEDAFGFSSRLARWSHRETQPIQSGPGDAGEAGFSTGSIIIFNTHSPLLPLPLTLRAH
ncbi:hypothetical protein SRHO_G00198600 [Serrasalmus rhombeus]